MKLFRKKTSLNIKSFICIVFLYVCCILLLSCSDNDLSNDRLNVQNLYSAKEELIAYPKNEVLTRAGSCDWEKWTKVLLASGDSVYVPWNKKMSGAAIPDEIRFDVNSKDGWELIAHTVNGFGERGLNYLVFHNVYTGILKVFYNLEPNQSNLQNTAIWKLHFEQPQSIWAFAGDIGKITSDKLTSDIYVSNITNDDSKGYTTGWNCFLTELAYDPDFTEGTLQIIPMSMTSSTFKIDGNIDSETKGVVITTTTTNPLNGVVKGTANLVGKSAEKWVAKQMQNGFFNSSFQSAAASSVGSIVKSGISSLLGKFVGAFDKNNQSTQAVNLSTESVVKLEGKIQTLQTGLIKPLSMSVSIKDVGRLGVWGLTHSPRMLVDPFTHLERVDSDIPYWYIYEIFPVLDLGEKQKVVVNPDLIDKIGKENVAIDIEHFVSSKTTSGCAFGITNSYTGGMYNHKLPTRFEYNNLYSGLEIYELYVPIKDSEGNVLENLDYEDVPYEIYIPTAPDGKEGVYPKFDCRTNSLLTFSVNLKTLCGDEISSVHTFVPHFEWDYKQFYEDYHLNVYPNVTVKHN